MPSTPRCALLIAFAVAACTDDPPPPPPADTPQQVAILEVAGLERARALGYAGDLEQAEAELARARGAGAPELELALVESELARLRGDADRALELAERAVELAPDSSAAQHGLARALTLRMRGGMLAAMGSLAAFKQALRSAVELDPGNVDARTDWIGFLAIVPGLAGGDKDEALRLARELQTVDERRGLVMTSFVQSLREETDAALATLSKALEAYPGDPELLTTRAMLFASEERLDEARRDYEAALAGEHDRGEGRRHHYMALYQLAKMRVEAGLELEEALAALETYADEAPLADLLPPRAGAHWRAGQALEQLGRTEEARRAFERALELDPDMEQAREELEALDE